MMSNIKNSVGMDGDEADAETVGAMVEMQHQHVRILFVIPEAVAAISTHNVAIRKELEKIGEVTTITDANALANIEYLAYSIIVLGSDNGTAWDTAKLPLIKTSTLPIMCCDSTTAAYMEIGTDGGDAAAKTDLNALATIDGSELGVGYHGHTGLDSGANTISASTTYNTLDMETDGDVTYTQYGYETTDDGTDVLLGFVWRVQPDGTIATDEDAAEIAANVGYYGPAYSAADLNALGLDVLWLACHLLIHGTTANLALTLGGEIGDLETKLLGNLRTKHTNTTPVAAFISGNTGGLGEEMPNNTSIRDLIGAVTGPYDGTDYDDNLYAAIITLSKYVADGDGDFATGRVLPSDTSLVDLLGDYTGPHDGAEQDDNVKAAIDLLHTQADQQWTPEDPQTDTVELTTQNVWYSVPATAYTSTAYVVKGNVTIEFPINQTYEVKVKRHAAGGVFGPTAQYVIGGTSEARTISIDPTEYLDVQCRCTTAAAQTVTWRRCLEFAKNSGAIAPTA